MPVFSEISLKKLSTCDNGLQQIFNEVIKKFDCRVIYGHRTSTEQQELFKQGRTYTKGEWVITDRLKTVTNCDGFRTKSNHNYMPSQAIDILPYPINYKDTKRMCYFAGWVMATADRLGIKLRWGGDWDRDTEVRDQTLMDLGHFELI